MSSPTATWPLAAFYGVYFAILGAWTPFWPLYLQSIGHGALLIGLIAAVSSASRIVAPNLWGYLADRYARRVSLIRIGCFGALLGLAGLPGTVEPVWILLFATLFGFFWSAVLPQIEVLALEHQGVRKSSSYGALRSWGSVGFIVAVTGFGLLFDLIEIGWFPWIMLLLLAALGATSLRLQGKPVAVGREPNDVPFASAMGNRDVWVWLTCLLLVQISFGAYYSFFSIYLQSLGYGRTQIGLIWSVGVLAEILFFLRAASWMALVGTRRLLLASLVATVLRWLLTPLLASNPVALFGLQLLHALSFGAVHVCNIEQSRRCFPAAQHGRGQALFNSIGYGLGGVLGAFASGLLWDRLHGDLYFVAAACAATAVVIGWLGIPRDGKHNGSVRHL